VYPWDWLNYGPSRTSWESGKVVWLLVRSSDLKSLRRILSGNIIVVDSDFYDIQRLRFPGFLVGFVRDLGSFHRQFGRLPVVNGSLRNLDFSPRGIIELRLLVWKAVIPRHLSLSLQKLRRVRNLASASFPAPLLSFDCSSLFLFLFCLDHCHRIAVLFCFVYHPPSSLHSLSHYPRERHLDWKRKGKKLTTLCWTENRRKDSRRKSHSAFCEEELNLGHWIGILWMLNLTRPRYASGIS